MIPMSKLLACYNKLGETIHEHCKEHRSDLFLVPALCQELAESSAICVAVSGETCFYFKDGAEEYMFYFNVDTAECVESYYSVHAARHSMRTFHMKRRDVLR